MTRCCPLIGLAVAAAFAFSFFFVRVGDEEDSPTVMTAMLTSWGSSDLSPGLVSFVVLALCTAAGMAMLRTQQKAGSGAKVGALFESLVDFTCRNANARK